MDKGFAGKIASVFLQSKLTILLMVIFMIIGVYSSFLIPREEEPQIEVPIADIFVGYPGASPAEIESKVAKPLEKIVSNLPGVEYVYSTSMNGKAMLIVQFYVGEDLERSFVQLYNEIIKHLDQVPQGVTMPLVKTRAIDDVPVLGLTFWSETYDDFQLKQLVEEVNSEIEKVEGVAITNMIGGRSQEVSVVLDKDKLAENKLDILSVAQMIQASNIQSNSGTITNNDKFIGYFQIFSKLLKKFFEEQRLCVSFNFRCCTGEKIRMVVNPASVVSQFPIFFLYFLIQF